MKVIGELSYFDIGIGHCPTANLRARAAGYCRRRNISVPSRGRAPVLVAIGPISSQRPLACMGGASPARGSRKGLAVAGDCS